MELKLLEDFLTVCETRNFTQAAQLRNITQSALSKRIRALEDWTGASLFDRSSYPLRLTAEGRLMQPQVREIISLFTRMQSGVRSLGAPSQSTVRLASLHTLRLTILPKWRASFLSELEPFQFEFSGNHLAYTETVKQFKSGQSDLLLTYTHPALSDGLDSDEYESLQIASERVIPVCAPDRNGQPSFNLDNGMTISYLSYGNHSFFARLLAWKLIERPLPLNITAVNPMCVGLMSLAEVGCGIAWLPESLIDEKLANATLVQAGADKWIVTCSIRIFRNRSRMRETAERIWSITKHRCEMSGPLKSGVGARIEILQ
jgi:DNA-binding transcriptional LysR family regulator